MSASVSPDQWALLADVPFLVAAMGSHGGGTGAGQRAMLAHLGVSERSIGAEIESEMDVIELGATGAHGIAVGFYAGMGGFGRRGGLPLAMRGRLASSATNARNQG